jgi:DNA-binding response OmpR family regulator
MTENKLILVIEDDPSTQVILQDTLENEGYTVLMAIDGVEGLGRLSQGYPALVLLDVHMPLLGGKKVVQILRARHVEVPLLILSADEANRIWAREIGAAAFLSKPFEVAELLELIKTLLPE